MEDKRGKAKSDEDEETKPSMFKLRAFRVQATVYLSCGLLCKLLRCAARAHRLSGNKV